MSGLVSVRDARAAVLSHCDPLPIAEYGPGAALGLVLAEPVVAGEAVPPFRNSSMDGYALRACDVATASDAAPVRLHVIGRVMAGDDPSGLVIGEGQAVRIMTGAVVPQGADAVCMIERTGPAPHAGPVHSGEPARPGETAPYSAHAGAAGAQDEGAVLVAQAVSVGDNVRLPGEDVEVGDEIFPVGTVVGPAHVGVLTSVGVRVVKAFRRPRVGVVSTGDELRSDGGPLAPGKIRDSNRPGLLARLASDGFEAVDLGWVADQPDVLAAALERASEHCDALLTSGGVSVGDADIVKMVLSRADSPLWFQVAVRPAKPFAFGRVGAGLVPVFGLPGNPVSALVSYELFARPSLRRMAGQRHLLRPVVQAVATGPFPRRPDGKLHLARGRLGYGEGGELVVSALHGQGSHQLRALADANCLVALPDGNGAEAGERVDAWVLGEMPATDPD
ncbi:MAG TPA: gephyrin-like molybdotransferase Glp [Acidimicrobiales bacterium]|nr:gephyrin-like molybdotransferase Glp [Acidimicrobiales bacterium]